MPLGIGLHMAIALFFAIHAMRNRQPMQWLFVLFAFPLLGSIVYAFAVYLPTSRLERGARRAVVAAARAMDPGGDVRAARGALEDAPTAQNRMRLAAALLAAGEAREAAEHYETCLTGPFASDPVIRLGAATAFTECARFADALVHVETLGAEAPDHRPEEVAILRARCLAGLSQLGEAREAFQYAVDRFDTYATKAEYVIWAAALGDRDTVARYEADLDRMAKRWTPLAREHHQPVQRRLRAALDLVATRP